MSDWEDANLIIVKRSDEDTYVAIVDQAQSRGNPEAGRVRNQTASAATLYALYRKIGPEIPAPQYEIDPEFEPFLRHARPQPPTSRSHTLPPPEYLIADWYGDPTGRNQHRYWDGTAWTTRVANDGVAATDELKPKPHSR